MFAPGDPLELALLEDMQGLGLDGGAGLADPLISKLISTLAPARRTRWRAAKDEIGSPHDRSFYETVGRVEVARDFLAYNLPPELLAAVESAGVTIASYACHRVIRVPANFKTLGMEG